MNCKHKYIQHLFDMYHLGLFGPKEGVQTEIANSTPSLSHGVTERER